MIRTGFVSVQNKFFLQVDTSINTSSINSTYLIQKYRLSSKMVCLVQCYSIENCRSASYYQDAISNCFLYSKHFAPGELTPLKNTLLYSKECKPKF